MSRHDHAPRLFGLAAGVAAFFQLRIGGKNTARDFGTHALGVFRGDHATGQIAVNLFQLIAIDTQVIGGGRFASPVRPAQKRQNQQEPVTANAITAMTIQNSHVGSCKTCPSCISTGARAKGQKIVSDLHVATSRKEAV